MKGVLRNVAVSLAIWATGYSLASWVSDSLDHATAIRTLENLWVVSVLAIGIVIAMIHKLHDLSIRSGASSVEVFRLERAIRKKTVRLWLLVALFVMAAALPRLPLFLAAGFDEHARAKLAVFTTYAALCYWFYVPFMLLEVSKYRRAVDRLADEQKRIDEHLKTFKADDPKA